MICDDSEDYVPDMDCDVDEIIEFIPPDSDDDDDDEIVDAIDELDFS